VSFLCWHRWTKWKISGEGYLQAEYDALTGVHLEQHEKFISGKYVRQQRECTKCGKVQLRRISA